MTQDQLKLKRGEYLQATIKKFITSEPKITIPELAYLIWELGDMGFIDIEKLLKEIKKAIKSKW